MRLVVTRYPLHDEPDEITFWRDVEPSNSLSALVTPNYLPQPSARSTLRVS